MKRKTAALMMALTLAVSLSACGDKTALQADTPDTTSVEETVETTEETEITEETEETGEEPTPEPMPEITPEEKLQSAIGEMPYYGDTSICAMTAEQATAFAQLIADGLAGDFSFRGGYDEGFDIISWSESFKVFDSDNGMQVETDRFNVMLGDFAGDGVPYLYVYGTPNSYSSSFEIYGWVDHTVKLVYDTDKAKAGKDDSFIYEDWDNQEKIKMNYARIVGPDNIYSITYEFLDGNIKEIDQNSVWVDYASNTWHVTENGAETVYTQEEYDALWENDSGESIQPHQHTLPYTCFDDMTPCTLEEMVNYLNAYASVMSDGQSVPVEIKKVDIVKHDGTGIITKGEVPQEKVDGLEILRQYMNSGGSSFYLFFGLEDINNDGIQELILSEMPDDADDVEIENGLVQIHFPPSYECLANVYGFDSTNKTYLVSESSECIIERLYAYDGTSFSELSYLEGRDDESGGQPFIIRENGVEREISKEEFWTIENDWSNRHTRISPKSANTHLDIENIENTFQVKIDVQNSGEWLVTNAE